VKAVTAKIISPWLRVFVLGLVACSFQLIPRVHAVETEVPSCPISISRPRCFSTTPRKGVFQFLSRPDADTSLPPQSYKYPKINPVLERKGYALLYDGRAKTAIWVYEELTRDSIKGDVDRNQFGFTQDPDIPEVIRSTPEDYAYSGFDGGHLAPAGDHKASKTEMKETFYVSNISPQLAGFNRGYWGTFEDHVRDLTNEYDVVRVVTGPLYLPHEEPDGKRYVTYQVIGENNVAVPTHFFKVITAEKGISKEQWAYIMPNEKIHKDIPLSDFQTTVDKVEKVAGVIFQR